MNAMYYLRRALAWNKRLNMAMSLKTKAFARNRLESYKMDYKEAKVIEVFC